MIWLLKNYSLMTNPYKVTSFAAAASVLPIGAHVFQPESRAGGQSSTDSGGCPRHAAATGDTAGL